MAPLPKKKTSKGRKGKRASHHALRPVTTMECPTCHNTKLPHRVCPSCGYYNGREMVPQEEVSAT